MKLIRYFLIAACALCVTATAHAQTTATRTTLAADLSATATVMSVTSATGFTVGNFVYADAEQMLIRAISGTSITVQRGVNGTAARAHDNAEVVLTGASDHFKTNDPDFGADCTRGSGQAAYLPWVNVRTGVVWGCYPAAGGWIGTTTQVITFNSIPAAF